MLGKLFILRVAELCRNPLEENRSRTNNERMSNLKRRKMEKKKIVVRKENAGTSYRVNTAWKWRRRKGKSTCCSMLATVMRYRAICRTPLKCWKAARWWMCSHLTERIICDMARHFYNWRTNNRKRLYMILQRAVRMGLWLLEKNNPSVFRHAFPKLQSRASPAISPASRF